MIVLLAIYICIYFIILEIENKNYFKENFKKLRQMQKNKQQNECTQPVKALWKSSKYENVESKLKEQLEARHD